MMPTIRHMLMLPVSTLCHWVANKHGISAHIWRLPGGPGTSQRRRIHGRANPQRTGIQTLGSVTRRMLAAVHFRVVDVSRVGVVRTQCQLLRAHTAFKAALMEDNLVDWTYLLHLIDAVLTSLAEVSLCWLEDVTQTLGCVPIHGAVQRSIRLRGRRGQRHVDNSAGLVQQQRLIRIPMSTLTVFIVSSQYPCSSVNQKQL